MANSQDRIVSIDIMRGITLLLMLFVNDLFVPGVPAWLTHKPADFDGMGLADWVFPGFLFMVGMSVPLALNKRFDSGESRLKVLMHIVFRTLGLLMTGILMYNSGRVNPALTGLSHHLWALLMLICVFLIFNNYKIKKWRWLKTVLLLIGITGLLLLVVFFRSGTAENPGWLKPGWWGILGLIGWGYLAGAITFFFLRHNLAATGFVMLIFLLINILSQLRLLEFLNILKPVFGILIEGNVPFIVLSGLFTTLVLQSDLIQNRKKTAVLLFMGFIALAAGFLLRNWFIVSKIKGTPSWGLLCIGISLIVFAVVYLMTDGNKKPLKIPLIEEAGRNSLTIYLAPDILYYFLWMTNLPVFIYKQNHYPLFAVLGSLVWALAMLYLGRLLYRVGIQLKL